MEIVAGIHLRAGRYSLVSRWTCDTENDIPRLMSCWGAYARGEMARMSGTLTDALPWYLVAMDGAELAGGPVQAAVMAVEVQGLVNQDLSQCLAGLRDKMRDGAE